MVIDFHIHYDPEKFIKPFLGPGGARNTAISSEGVIEGTLFSLRYDLPKFIEMMDHGGVDIAVLTSGLGMRSASFEECRFINDDIREQGEKYSGRFKGAAHVPPFGGRETYDELRRCRDDLGFKGACIHTRPQGVYLDMPELYPYYEAVEELGMFLIVHPGSTKYAPKYDYDFARSIWREGHLAETTARLIEGGILDRFPDLKIVMSHLGGHFYPMISRMELYQDKEFWGTQDDPRHSKKSKMPFRWYLDKMYFDTGGIQGDLNPVRMALLELKPQNILYGTDFPIEIKEGSIIKKFVDGFRALELPQGDIDDILGNNALRLLGMI